MFRTTILISGLLLAGMMAIADDQAGTDAPATMSAADARRAAILFIQCRACHAVDAEEGHLVGPNLANIFGSVAGKREGFIYSDSMATSDLVWDHRLLDEFLVRPNDLFPGTKMAFVGVMNEADRRLLIEYLRSISSE